MDVQIKLTKSQHEVLIEHQGSEGVIKPYLELYLYN